MANLEKDVLATIEALPDLPPSMAPIIAARKNAVAFAGVRGAPIGFEAWLSFIANALVVTESAGAPFSAVTWPATPAPNTADLRWFVHRLRIAIFAECALSLPGAGWATSVKGIAPQLGISLQTGRPQQQSRANPSLHLELRYALRTGAGTAGRPVF